jgi:dephospho-CoA kinase
VSSSGRKPIIGILGGIGSGKSTVANEFAKLGCAVVDADKIAHRLLDEAGIREQIVGLFGQRILNPAGKIDRGKLAEIVFADREKLSLLNKTIHPLVLKEAEQLIRRHNSQSRVKAIVLDMPLLLDVGWEKRCHRLIFVQCDPQIRAQRAGKMGFFDENQLKVRENFQISLDKKVGVADNIIENNSGFSALVRQVANIFSSVLDKS